MSASSKRESSTSLCICSWMIATCVFGAAALSAGCARIAPMSRVHDRGPEFENFVVAVNTNENEIDLAARLKARFGRKVDIRPLFDTPSANLSSEMQRMFRVRIPAQELPTRDNWENAYRIETELKLAAVEPDLETTLDQVPESTATCEAQSPPPNDVRWSLAAIRAPEAWVLPVPSGGKSLGEGITVCHPDTGWTDHVDLDTDRLDISRALNLLKNGTADGKDPLLDQGLLKHPGHGTATGSVIVSSHERGRIAGVAPRARLVPIRTAKSVVQVFDSDLARAVNYAVDAKCDIVSMSLGGRAFFGLEAAIRRAVKANVIVAAAAGNCVGFVVAPAAYDDTLAVAAVNVLDTAWVGSSRGPAVDISAPGEHVWVAKRNQPNDPSDAIKPGEGTSYAVANVAGAAALWLSYHGKESLQSRYQGQASLQEVFRKQIQATARVPSPWPNGRLGPGVLNAEQLLRAPLPAVTDFNVDVPESGAGQLTVIANVLGRSPRETATLLAAMLKTSVIDLEDELDRWGPELTHLALAYPDDFRARMSAVEGLESSSIGNKERISTEASASLRAMLDRTTQ